MFCARVNVMPTIHGNLQLWDRKSKSFTVGSVGSLVSIQAMQTTIESWNFGLLLKHYSQMLALRAHKINTARPTCPECHWQAAQHQLTSGAETRILSFYHYVPENHWFWAESFSSGQPNANHIMQRRQILEHHTHNASQI